MRKTLIAIIGALAVITATLGSQFANAATIRYATPTGTGTACTQTSPCSVTEAVVSAGDGDTVQLAAEEYNLSSTLAIIANNLTIRGPAGINNPGDHIPYLIFTDPMPHTDSKINLFGSNVRFERVGIVGNAGGSAHIISGDGASYDQVLMINFGDSDTLRGRNVTVTNSVVSQFGASTGAAAAISGMITGSTIFSQRGTAILQTAGYVASPDCSTTIRNTLAWGESSNLTLDNSGGSCPSIDIDYDYSWISNVRSPRTGGGMTFGGGSVSLSPGSHNLPDATVVFDPTDPRDTYISDLVLPPDSPAIDAGCTASCSDQDFYGRPRPIGEANDIGAMEQSLAPTMSAIATGPVGATTARISVNIDPRGAASTYSIQYRKAGDSAWAYHLDGDITAALFGPTTVSANLTGLASMTDYEAQVTSRNSRGDATPLQVAFRTGAPSVNVAGLKAKVTRKKAKLTSSVEPSDAGTITQIATAGKSTKPRCKTTKAAAEAGSYALTCPLSKKTRKELRRNALKLKVTTTLKLADGATATKKSKLKVKRQR